VIYCSLIAPLLWSPLLCYALLSSPLLRAPLRCAVLRCSGWRSDAVRSPSPAASLEMIEAHAARSIEEGECLRTHASGWPRGHSEDGWGVGCMSVSSFAIIERLISGRQIELERYSTVPIAARMIVRSRVYLPVLESRLAFEALLREMAECDGPAVLRSIQILPSDASLSISHLSSPISHLLVP